MYRVVFIVTCIAMLCNACPSTVKTDAGSETTCPEYHYPFEEGCRHCRLLCGKAYGGITAECKEKCSSYAKPPIVHLA